MISTLLKNAWQLYRQHFWLITAAVVIVWLPLDLLSSYMDYFVFDEDDFRRSFRFARFLDNFFGIIATAAVIFVGYTSVLGEQPTLQGAMSTGLRAWGRMWWTRFLSGIALLIGFLLLVVPGIYLLVRLALVEPVAVCERVSGSAAMRRSFELTQGKFWQVFLLGLAYGGLLVVTLASLILPTVLIPELDHWLVDAATALIGDVVAAFGTLCLLSAYVMFSNEQDATATPGE